MTFWYLKSWNVSSGEVWGQATVGVSEPPLSGLGLVPLWGTSVAVQPQEQSRSDQENFLSKWAWAVKNQSSACLRSAPFGTQILQPELGTAYSPSPCLGPKEHLWNAWPSGKPDFSIRYVAFSYKERMFLTCWWYHPTSLLWVQCWIHLCTSGWPWKFIQSSGGKIERVWEFTERYAWILSVLGIWNSHKSFLCF